MNKTEEKGVTLVVLVTTIVLILLISSLGTMAGISTLDSVRLSQFKKELKILQVEVDELNQNNQFKNDEFGQALTNKQEEIFNISEINNIIFSGKTDEEKAYIKQGFRYCNKEYISKQFNFSSIKRDYYINVEYRYIICSEGIEKSNKMYYMINQFEDGIYVVEYKNEKVN